MPECDKPNDQVMHQEKKSLNSHHYGKTAFTDVPGRPPAVSSGIYPVPVFTGGR